MQTLGTALMFAAAAALIIFPPLYHRRTRGRWRKSTFGIHLMSFMGVLGMVMGLAVLRVLGVDLPAWVRPLVWLAIGVVSWWRVGVLIHETRGRDRVPR